MVRRVHAGARRAVHQDDLVVGGPRRVELPRHAVQEPLRASAGAGLDLLALFGLRVPAVDRADAAQRGGERQLHPHDGIARLLLAVRNGGQMGEAG